MEEYLEYNTIFFFVSYEVLLTLLTNLKVISKQILNLLNVLISYLDHNAIF